MLLNRFVWDDKLDDEEAAIAAGAEPINTPGATANSDDVPTDGSPTKKLRTRKSQTWLHRAHSNVDAQ